MCVTCCIAEAGHVFLILHNIDGVALRSSKVQTILSMLACLHGLHIVASVDHVSSHLRECITACVLCHTCISSHLQH